VKRERLSWLIYFILIFLLSNCSTTPSSQKANGSQSISGDKAVSRLSESNDTKESFGSKPSTVNTKTREFEDSKERINPSRGEHNEGEGNQGGGINRSEDLIQENVTGLPVNSVKIEDNSSLSGGNDSPSNSVHNIDTEERENKLIEQGGYETPDPDKELTESVLNEIGEPTQSLDQKISTATTPSIGGNNSRVESSKTNENNDVQAEKKGQESGLESYFGIKNTDEFNGQTKIIQLSPEEKKILVKEGQQEIGFIQSVSSPEDLDVSVSKLGDQVRTNKNVNQGTELSGTHLSDSSVVLSSQSELDPLNKANDEIGFKSDQLTILEDEVDGKVRIIGMKDNRRKLSFPKSLSSLQVRFKDEVDIIPQSNDNITPSRDLAKYGNTPNGYVNIRSFLNRNEDTKSDKDEEGFQEFTRAKSFLDTKKKSINSAIFLEEDLKAYRYEKTLEWINNRGRSLRQETVE
jgi:hypothetical protein